MSKDYEQYSLNDWVGLYIDGELVDEGHSIDLREVLRYLGVRESPRSANVERIIEEAEEGDFYGFPLDLEDLISKYGVAPPD